jgi:hypothetical protein
VLSSLQTETRWAFWSSLSSLGTNFAEIRDVHVFRRSSGTLIVVDRRSSVLEAFVPKKGFSLAHGIISEGSL